ncbi:MAG: hypothetical protein V4463_20665 [Pseudomonadota bacterium]
MLSTLQYRILNACAGLALALLLSNIWLYVDNRGAVAELEQRQLFLQQTSQLQALYQDIAKALAEAGLKSNDGPLLAMLAGQGIRVSPPAAQEKK